MEIKGCVWMVVNPEVTRKPPAPSPWHRQRQTQPQRESRAKKSRSHASPPKNVNRLNLSTPGNHQLGVRSVCTEFRRKGASSRTWKQRGRPRHRPADVLCAAHNRQQHVQLRPRCDYRTGYFRYIAPDPPPPYLCNPSGMCSLEPKITQSDRNTERN